MMKTAAVASTPDPNVFPNSSVCLIEDILPGVGEFRGSGVIIGPHTILTAAHVLWDADSGVGAADAKIMVGSTVIGGSFTFHYNHVDDRDDQLSRAGSSRDYAVINTTSDLSSFGAFDITTDFDGGRVNVSGYPANRGLAQTETRGAVSPGPVGVLNYKGFALAPGYSGGPLWVNEGTAADPAPAVAGLVSTTRWGSRMTPAAVRQIQRWETADADLWTDTAARAPARGTSTNVLSAHEHASAAAFITGDVAPTPCIDAGDPWAAATMPQPMSGTLTASIDDHDGPGRFHPPGRASHFG